jgi:hypothetical protein
MSLWHEEGIFSFVSRFLPQNTLKGFYDFLQLLEANPGVKEEVYFQVHHDSLFHSPVAANVVTDNTN